MENVVDLLQRRGFIDSVTHDALPDVFTAPQKVYCGFDPTAESLHLGNLVAIVGLAWCQRFGHTPVAVIGGATARVGDPSGKSLERPLLSPEVIEKNSEGICQNLRQILDFDHPTAKPIILNNHDWFGAFSLLDFLRDVGKHFRVGPMLAKEAVKTRLDSEEGLSFTEFSYQLLQAYDFYTLQERFGVSVQLGGSDQWGNITAGTELIRRLSGKKAYGMTFPLLTRSDGKKFGKSESGAVWLSANHLSPYQFYQYLFSLPDADVVTLLKMLTFLPMDEIHKVQMVLDRPDAPPNYGQKILATEVTRLVHGEEGLSAADKVTGGLRPGREATLSVEVLEAISADMPNKTVQRDEVLAKSYVEVLLLAGVQSSKGEARRLVRGGGAYLNNEKVQDEARSISESDLVGGCMLLLGIGKKKKVLLRLVDSQ